MYHHVMSLILARRSIQNIISYNINIINTQTHSIRGKFLFYLSPKAISGPFSYTSVHIIRRRHMSSKNCDRGKNIFNSRNIGEKFFGKNLGLDNINAYIYMETSKNKI